jgi:hypothetical protein
MKMKYKCPCCGYYTFSHKLDGEFDKCPVCYWIDDPIQMEDPDYHGGANISSLNQARVNYKKYGAVEERLISCVRKPRRGELAGID